MEHPNKEQRLRQAEELAKLPDKQRKQAARMFRLGNAAFVYHRQANELEPTEEDFKEWLEGLPENIRRDMEIKGFELCKGVLSFKRHVLEKNDIGMDEWMKWNLSEEDYEAYSATGNSLRNENE